MAQEMKELLPLDQTVRMEDDQKEKEEQNSPPISSIPVKSRKKGGIITMPFIVANEALERTASFGLTPNMTLYLMNDYRMGLKTAQNLLFFWGAATNFLPIVGAFVADSYLGRFVTIGFGCIFSLIGTTMLWLTAMIPKAKPPPCQAGQVCKSTSTSQFAFLVFAFMLMSIGAGGIRPCSLAFGANQFDKSSNPNNLRVLETFFAWYYAASIVSVLIAMTALVYLQDKMGWKIGFGVPALLMFLSALFFFLASPFYIKKKVRSNLFTSLIKVVVVAYKNRKLPYPTQQSGYHHKYGSELKVPTQRLRFLNKACIIRSPEDLKPNGLAANPWSLCTVDQVEELKALIRIVPLWSTGIMVSMNMSQSSFPFLQAKSMDRHIGKLEIPAGSIGMFMMIALTLWILLYDRVLIPLASKIRGKQVRIRPITRMGIGIFLSGMCMLVSGLVEHVRKKRVMKQGLMNNPNATVDMSAMWLILPNVISGIAEAFSAIGQTEFYYSELPKNMSSLASALFGLNMAIANLLATVMFSVVDKRTGGKGKESWISSNINIGHYEYYYWLLSIMTALNLVYFVFCGWLYGPTVDVDITKRMFEGSDDEMPPEIESKPDSKSR